MNILQFIGLTLTASAFASCSSSLPQLGKDSIDDVIAAMTMEEKARFVIGTGMEGMSGDSAIVGETRGLVPGAAGTTYPIPRLGIPSIVLADGPAGLRISPTRDNDTATYYCTHFPIGTVLASTWNQELVENVGKAIGNETLEYGADVLLAPALNIHRNPLCGRNFEYYSEDPVVSGKIASAYVKGIQSNGVGTSIKHFAANNQETNRKFNDVHASPRALREIYLKGFEIAIKESAPWTVMSSYNYLNGTYTSESKELLTTLLRDEWNFDGMVMTDWFGGDDAVAQMIAGNDMLQPGLAKQYNDILKGLKDGTLDEKVIDKNIRNILNLILKTPRFKGYKYSNKPDLIAHAAITRQSATEGMVLLKNNNQTLPMPDNIKNIALYGCTSYDFIAGGTGSGNVNRAYTVSLLDGLSNAGYSVNNNLKEMYEKYNSDFYAEQAKIKNTDRLAQYMPKKRPVELVRPINELIKDAQNADIAMMTIGRGSGEFVDRTSADFNLSKEEKQMIQNICKAFHAQKKKVIIVLNVAGVIETSSWKDQPDAILLSWLAGQEGGNSVTDILSGKVSPSGKLTMTFPVKLEDVASTKNFPIDMNAEEMASKKEGDIVRNWDYTDYEEDIYIGYRYFDTFNKNVSYPFGYGLSYTQFEYSQPEIKSENGEYVLKVNIRNTGKTSGKEVVELYVSAPKNDKLPKPEKELKDFAKTKELKPGESQTVTLKVNASDLASYDEGQHAWIVDEGNYQFKIGTSSEDIKATVSADVKASKQETSDILLLKTEFKKLSFTK